MNIDITKFNLEDVISFNENIDFNKEDLLKVEILDINNCIVSGSLFKLDDDLYELNMNIKGIMFLECALSLEETEYNFNIVVNKTLDNETFEEENIKIDAKTLDIFPIIWENIVLEKPARIVKPDNKGITKGEGWSLMDELVKENNSELSELSKLLNMEEKK